MIDPEVMLEYYKEQSTVEREFRFIKDGRFHVSEVYLENENRIAALAMIMCSVSWSIQSPNGSSGIRYARRMQRSGTSIRSRLENPA